MFKRGVVVFGLMVILITIVTAIFAPQIAPYNPNKTDLRNALLQPNSEHLLGTDALGRDTLSRMIFGAQVALLVGLMATGVAASLGMTLGLIAGYFGGIIYMIIMRLVDALMAFPIILLSLVLAVLLGGGLTNIMIAVGIGLSATYARVMCGTVLSVRENEYVLAARTSGAGNLRIMLRHILMNCFPPMIVLITINMGSAIMIEAALSYLGVGIAPPGTAWGSMVTDGYRYLLTHPTLALVPGVAIMLVVFSFNMVGDGLRDTLDPRLRGTI
ncbi:MAG: ABC transporter permease [candidate division Zixibacteria bacterium RBG_16_53_22]|nr:MAG: ABC transporter permease [candidate division Zixibacteria bacterium RBG_16_53_22]